MKGGAKVPTCWAVVVAAGRGRRLGLGINKVFYRLMGRSVLGRSLDALGACGLIDGMVLVLAEDDFAAYDALVQGEGACPLIKKVVAGGATRQESVNNGLMAVPESVELIAIHDAARAFVPASVVRATIERAAKVGTGVAATLISDTIKRVDHQNCVLETLDRGALRAVQTPQTFRRDIIVKAHAQAEREGYLATDDAALVEHYFGSVQLVISSEGGTNRKLTTQEDLDVMEKLLTTKLRVGQGFDAHRLVAGRPLVLCGVTIAHEKGLDGHSDADVAVHALIDALLGAAGLGDIGRHFPDCDPAYKGICSMALLSRVVQMLQARAGQVLNCDVTIVAQRPKIAPYIEEMARNLARALLVDADCVNVKATTTERMGYEGREEGISASAVTLVSFS